MSLPILLAASWPDWSSHKGLLLSVPPECWPLPPGPLRLDGIVFQGKHELHVTAIGRRLGSRLQAAIDEGHIDAAALRATVESLPWTMQRSSRYRMLCKPRVGQGDAYSLIERVRVPALHALYEQLGMLLGHALSVPPAHVTLYVAGDAKGIAVPDMAALRKATVRRVAACELR